MNWLDKEIEDRRKNGTSSKTLKDEEYAELRKETDVLPMDVIQAEALAWNSLKIRPGTFRRNYNEPYFPW